MVQFYETVDGHLVSEGEDIFWYDSFADKWNKSSFMVEYRYGEIYEIQLGYESGGYTTRRSIYDLEKDIYKFLPKD